MTRAGRRLLLTAADGRFQRFFVIVQSEFSIIIIIIIIIFFGILFIYF